jgi:hypothetical protein
MPESRGEAVLIATGGLIWMEKVFSPDAPGLVTRTLKFEVPTAVGVPLMTPVVDDSDNPAGKFPCPATRDHV